MIVFLLDLTYEQNIFKLLEVKPSIADSEKHFFDALGNILIFFFNTEDIELDDDEEFSSNRQQSSILLFFKPS